MTGIRRVSQLGTTGESTYVDGSIQTADIADGAIQTADIAIGAVTQIKLSTDISLSGMRNKIINGDFSINQRGFTTSTTTGAFGFDRWFQQNSGGTVTMSAQQFTTGSPAVEGFDSPNFCRMVVSGQSASSDYAVLSQRIEDVRTLARAPFVISFWAKAASGTPSIAIEFEQNFGTGGSPSATVQGIISINQPITTSWARYSISSSGLPSLLGKTIGTNANSFLQLNLWLSGGSGFSSRVGTIVSAMGVQNNTFDIWGVQVERGQPATPFEQRPIGVELALCQRYFHVIPAGNIKAVNQYATVGLSGGNLLVSHSFPVTMRTEPTVYTSAGSGSHSFDFYQSSAGAGIARVLVYQSGQSTTTIGFKTLAYSSDNNGGNVIPSNGHLIGILNTAVWVSAEL